MVRPRQLESKWHPKIFTIFHKASPFNRVCSEFPQKGIDWLLPLSILKSKSNGAVTCKTTFQSQSLATIHFLGAPKVLNHGIGKRDGIGGTAIYRPISDSIGRNTYVNNGMVGPKSLYANADMVRKRPYLKPCTMVQCMLDTWTWFLGRKLKKWLLLFCIGGEGRLLTTLY